MISYSLVRNINTPNDILNSRDILEQKAKQFWSSSYSIDEIDEYTKIVCEGDLLLEFSLKDFIMDNLSNVLQGLIGFALEGGITIGSLGTGTPVAAAAEMANDIIFFGYSVADFVVGVKGVFSEIMELKETLVDIFSTTIADRPQDIYDTVKEAISGIGELIDKIGGNFEEWMEKVTKAFRSLLVKIAKPAADLAAMISPIPGTDLVVQNAITEFADDAFKLFMKAYNKAPDWLLDLIHDTKALKAWMGEMMTAASETLEKIITKAKDEKFSITKAAAGLLGAGATGGVPIVEMLKYSGAGEKILKWLTGTVPGYINKAIDMIAKIYPIFMSGLSAVTIIVTEDF